MSKIKRVAIIGAGPAGAIAIDAFARERAFNVIRVFERREQAGGCWLEDPSPHPPLTSLSAFSTRTADPPLPLPAILPAQTASPSQPRHAETPIYPHLETNVDATVMSFSAEPIPTVRSAASVALHGPDTPFRPWRTIQAYISSLMERNNYLDLVSFSTTVERVTKRGEEWDVVLRKAGKGTDYWWRETFDAVVVANGHYSVPYVPHVPGLEALEARWPGSVEHSKAYRGAEKYRDKKVVVVGASVSGADLCTDLVGVARGQVFAVVEGHRPNVYFGDAAFWHPGVTRVPSIRRVEAETRTVVFEDGTEVRGVDHLVFATGYSWSLPFLPQVEVRNNRVPGLYLHVFHQSDPTLVLIGAVAAGLTFKVYEWQAVLAARVLAGRAKLPPVEEQRKWEEDRIKKKGDGVPFTALWDDFEGYFETVRRLAGEQGPGRQLPRFDPDWVRAFLEGHERRKIMWEKRNSEARERRDRRAKVLARL
ncbi:Thiol-specific monooxygenase [Elsinoe australis]|uniref:Thiol-specific monooxygenase n=1 Tax=Elsinoe australis TaxID=40998 RepID=A0A2P7YQ75_9PEZI|nr:Thiol-specific monooxygenase [Elsinoe australis]